MPSRKELDYYWGEIDRAHSALWGTGDSSLRSRWIKFRDDYAGKQKRPAEGIVINVTFALVENFMPMLMTRAPRIICTPRRRGDESSSRAKQLWLQYQTRRTRLFRESRRVIQDALIYGIGYWKIGLTSYGKPTTIPGTRRPQNPEAPLVPTEQVAGEFEGESPLLYESFAPWIKRVSPFDLCTAPGFSELDDSPYVIQRIFLPLEELRRRPDLRHTSDLTPTARNTQEREHDSNPVTGDIGSDDREYVECYEVWDQVRRKMILLAEGKREVALKDVDWPYPALEGFPIKSFVPFPIPGQYYGYSMVDLIADHQEELNIIRGIALSHLKRSCKVAIVDENMVDEELARKLSQPLPWAMHPARNFRPDGIIEFPSGEKVPYEIYGLNNVLLEGIRLVTGFSDVSFGATTKTKTATEASMMGEALSVRVQYKRKVFEDALLQVVRALDQIGRMGVTQEEYVWITGPDGLQSLPFTPKDAMSEVDVEIAVDTTVDPPDDPVRKKQMLDFFNVAVNPMVVQLAGTNVPEVAAEAARAVGYNDPERFFPILREPQAPQDENLLLITGQRVPIHPRDDHQLHLTVHQAIAPATPPEYLQRYQEHVMAHQNAIQTLLAQAAAGPGAAGMGGPMAPRRGELAPEGMGGPSDNGGDLRSLFGRGQQGNNR